MNVLQAMLARRSCRDFTAEPVTEKEIEQLLLAANAAPVGMARFDAIALSVIQDPRCCLGSKRLPAPLPMRRRTSIRSTMRRLVFWSA